MSTDNIIDIELINRLHKEFGFTQDFDLNKKLHEIKKFVTDMKISLSQNPRASVQKKKLLTYIKNAAKLRLSLNDLHPQMQKGINVALGEAYPEIIQTNYDTPLKMHEFYDLLTTLKGLCQFSESKVKRRNSEAVKYTKKISTILSDQIEEACNGFGECRVNLNNKINLIMHDREILIISNDALSYIDNAIQAIIYACEVVLSELGNGAGRSFDAMARNFLVKLAYIYESGTGNKPIVYYSKYADETYSGEFYKFILRLSAVFKHDNELGFLKNPGSIGKMSISALKTYDQFMIAK